MKLVLVIKLRLDLTIKKMERDEFDSLKDAVEGTYKVLFFEVYQYHDKNDQLYDDLPYSFHLKMVKNIVNYHMYDILNADKIDWKRLNQAQRNDFLDEIAILQISSVEHDLIEDTRLKYHDIIKLNNKYLTNTKVSEKIADIVYALTDEKGKNRNERHNDKYWDVLINTDYASYIKLCDIYANLYCSKYITYNRHLLKMYSNEISLLEKRLNSQDKNINCLISKLKNL